jgi:hypothetical protein
LKLPGLDEPLTVETGTAKGRPIAGSPLVPLPAAIATPPAPPETLEPATGEIAAAVLPQGDAGTGDIRYVPVTDPADAGETATDQAALSSSVLEARLEPAAVPAAEMASPAALALAAVKLSTGLTPDRRLADELLPRADASGETVDAELAATMDRLSSDHGAGPTPAVIGQAILGPVSSASAIPEDVAGGGADFEPAAETRLAHRVAEETPAPTPQAPFRAKPEDQADTDDFALDFSAFDRAAAPPETRVTTPMGFGDVDASMTLDLAAGPVPSRAAGEAPEDASGQPRPYVRGKSAERRRPPSRYGRGDRLTPTPGAPGDEDAGVPRAFEQARPTPVLRPTPDFELLTRPDSSRPWVFPGLAGVAAGLILGLAAGYWLGTRNAAPAATPPAQAAASGQPASAPVPASPAATTPSGAPKPAVQAEATSAVPPGTPSTSPAAPQRSVAVPPAASEPSPRPSAALSGTITVTATQQANVDLDGERKGMTPRSLKNLPLGSHTVRVTRPGYAPQEQTVVLTAEEPAAGLAFTLRPGSAAPSAAASPSSRAAKAPAVTSVLIVFIESTPPGALIRIDGRNLGPTPLTVRQMRPGTHTLELRMPGYKPWSQRLTVAAGDNRRVTASLERDNTR